jgi:hypothetical protein
MKLNLDQIIERRRKINATASTRQGRLVRDTEHLMTLAKARRSVYCANTWGLIPATFIMGMPANIVHLALSRGEIREYHKIKK